MIDFTAVFPSDLSALLGGRLFQRVAGSVRSVVLLLVILFLSFALSLTLPFGEGVAESQVGSDSSAASSIATSAVAEAEQDWLSAVSTCEQLRSEIKNRFGAVSDLTKFDKPTQEALQKVIDVACGERFAECRFKVCSRQLLPSSSIGSTDESISSVAVSSASSSLDVAAIRGAAASLSNQIIIAPLIESSAAAESSESSRAAVASSSSAAESISAASSELLAESSSASSKAMPFVVDPMAWLTQSFSCDQFLEQAQVRYAVFGSWAEFPETKKQEMRLVLEAACGEKFSMCSFPMCPLDKHPVTEAVDLLLGNVTEPASAEASSVAQGPELQSSALQSSAQQSSGEASSVEVSSIPVSSVQVSSVQVSSVQVSSVQVSSAESSQSNLEQEWKLYRATVERLKTEQRELITATEKREKEQGLIWQRFVIPEDVQEEREDVVRETKPETKPASAPAAASTSSAAAVVTKLAPAARGEKHGRDQTEEWLDQDANNLQIGILPPLPPPPPKDPFRRK